MPSTLSTLLFFHLLGFLLLGSGTVLGSIVGASARRTRSVAEHRVYARLMGRVAPLNGLGGLTLLLTGTAMVWYGGYGFTTFWIAATYVNWVIAIVTASALSRPQGAAIGAAVAGMVDRTESDELPALYGSPMVSIALRIHETVFLVSFLLMVFKPGA